VRLGPSADSSSEGALIETVVSSTILHCSGEQIASFGIRYRGTGERWGEFKTKTVGCTIDSTGASSSSYGAVNGLILAAEPTGDGYVLFRLSECDTTDNTIKGHRGAGVLIKASSGTSELSDAHIQSSEFMRNDIRDNDGPGVKIDWGTSGYLRYINWTSQNNLIVDNQYGFYGVNGAVSGAQNSFAFSSNDTVADNTYEAYYDADGQSGVATVSNGIVWGNNGGGTQHNYGSTWACNSVSFTDMQNLSCTPSNRNINQDPLFVDAANGDYHLDGTGSPISPCIDVGDSTPAGPPEQPRVDIDAEPHQQDDDGNGSQIIDMGADEFPDPTP